MSRMTRWGTKAALMGLWGGLTLAVLVLIEAWPWAVSRARLTVVLEDLPNDSVLRLAEDIRSRVPEVRKVIYWSKTDGLKKLGEAPGFDRWGVWLADNPIPAVLEVHLAPWHFWGDRLMRIFDMLRTRPGVQMVVGEVPAIRAWLALLFGAAAGLMLLWGCMAVVSWWAWQWVVNREAEGAKGVIQETKAAGGRLEGAVQAASRHQGGDWVAGMILTAGGLWWMSSWMEPFLKLVKVGRGEAVIPAILVTGVAAAILSRLAWRRAVERVWSSLPS